MRRARFSHPRSVDEKLFPGEEVWAVSGYQSLVRYFPGNAQNPLIVLVPGAAHLGRIFYGYPRGRDDDFLVHWLTKAGYPVLVVSYPLQQSMYTEYYPALSAQGWASLTMAAVKQAVTQYQLSPNVVVTCWSMAGSLYAALLPAAATFGITI